ncbi:MAG: hypothetical protein CMI16_06885 [Opitutaceae bacterium]|nr:hypothetical protein [Opitutaceae bacterium]
MGLFSSDGRGFLVAGLLLVATASSALAAEDFVITASFGSSETFALGEFAALVEKCKDADFADPVTSTELKAQCVHGLISTSAVCSTVGGKFMCTVNGVQIDTADVTFTCDEVTGCPSVTTDTALSSALGGISCGDAVVDPPGFTGTCFESAYCLQTNGTSYEQFGEFCPSATGEYCCGDAVARDTGYFPGGESVGASNLPSGTEDFLRRVDHVVDMNFDIKYTVEAPAQLKIEVEVPYVTSGSTVTYTEDGDEKVYDMCPSTYMIDFEAPIESRPQALAGETLRSNWLPLYHFPHSDLVGRPRSSCGNYDMTYADEASFKAGFKYADDGSNTFAYGGVPAVDASVWDPSVSVVGIPNGADTFWKIGSDVGGRVNYTSGSVDNGFFDLVKTHYMCKDYNTNNKLVTKVAEPEPSYINGVAYPVETYEWTLSVCQVGFFGLGCADANRQQMYAKTCAKVPASFSVSPQQVSHVAVSPVSETIVSKTFLQSVKSVTSDDCAVGSERIVLTLNLVLISADYAISDDAGHDIISPSGILEDVGGASGSADEEEDLVITEKNFASTDAFLADPSNANIASGVYRLNVMDLNSVATNVRYRKIVVVTKCYDTGYDAVEGTRATPAVFSEAVANGADNVLVDVEVIVKKTVGSQTDDVKNTLNLRVLATKESLVLQSEDKLTQKDVTAYQKLYGSYEIAKMDVGIDLLNALPVNAEMSGGDQICSKHQIQEYDAQVSNLIPNAVGACMLTASGAAAVDGAGTLVMGRTIKYKAGNMVEPADYTFGCFQDWIDVSGVSPTDGVYVIPNQLTRIADTHDSIFWFVQKEELSTASLPRIGETLDSRFGTGLFYYNSTSGGYVVTKSDQMQLDKSTKQLTLTDPAQNAPGCVNTGGNMRSACNLVCFDLVDGLLTDPLGSSPRQVLVHHVSVATVATEDQSTGPKKFGAKHRRMLLESASVTQRSGAAGDSTTDTATTGISVLPGPLSENVTVDVNASTTTLGYVTRDFDGPTAARVGAFVVGPLAAVVILVVVMVCLGKRQDARRKYYGNQKVGKDGLTEELIKNAPDY